MEFNGKRVLVCNCEQTMALDGKALGRACAAAGAAGDAVKIHHNLCRAELGVFQEAVAGEAASPLIVACTQEAPLFNETREESNPEAQVAYTNIRERAGWSEDGGQATAKIAALLAESALDVPPTPSVTLKSDGICLVYGRDEQAIEAARQLAGRLDVTVLLERPQEVVPPRVMDVPVFKGAIKQARGHLGRFAVNVDDYAPAIPASRRYLEFEPGRDGAFSECHLILDLSGGQPLFPAPEKRDGYFRPDPGNPAAVQRALFEVADMVGEFEKPRYVAYNADICAHSRSHKTGCTRCLDLCPASAIRSIGDTVEIDPYVCGGCGSCASVCPTGAASYALPPGEAVFERLRTLVGAYLAAGGENPVLLVHDVKQGEEMIAMMGRFGRGLPARVVPFAVNAVTQVGFDFFAAALAYGVSQIRILAGPAYKGELDGLAGQIGLAEAAMAGLGYGAGRVGILDTHDPLAAADEMYALPRMPAPAAGSFLPMGGKRTLIMLALRHLYAQAPEPVDILPLAPGAPFGGVEVNAGGCTLCLACVGACPTGAMIDNPDRPMLSFQEEACVQCGLCQTTCPEKVITLVPRFNFTEAARAARVVNQEEPFHCVRCGKPFGIRSSIEHMVEQLAGKHWMFQSGDQAERIGMCDDCRVIVQFERPDDPLAGPPRPLPRTTDDYLREREIEQARAKLGAERKDGEG
ncbi:MAG: 4Fe-4S binding protein [Kiloniellales bacterium]